MLKDAFYIDNVKKMLKGVSCGYKPPDIYEYIYKITEMCQNYQQNVKK